MRSGSGKNLRWVLPDDLRDEMKEVVGKIVSEQDIPGEVEGSFIVTIGDVVTLTLLELGFTPDISIVDYKTKRMPMSEVKKKLSRFSQPEIHVVNPAAGITEELWLAIRDGYANPRNLRIVVDGEEDLASLACIALAPDNTSVIYGIPNRGPMVLHVDQSLRSRVEKLLKRMEI
jgi:uncharacterized protein (UPF0218 family)